MPRDLHRNCEGCGTGLTARAQRFCKGCTATVFPNPLSEKLRANATWEKVVGQKPVGETYLREIAPGVSLATIDGIMRATGLSKVTCQMIRSRRFVPHPRHWEALSKLGLEPS